jgi:hypothetical protein
VGWLTLAGMRCSFQKRLLMWVLGRLVCRGFIQKVADTLAHLSSRFIGEGKGEDFMGMIHLGEQFEETTSEQPCFSRTGRCLQVKAPVDIKGRGPNFLVRKRIHLLLLMVGCLSKAISCQLSAVSQSDTFVQVHVGRISE